VIAINPVLRFEPPETKTGPLDPRRHFCRPSGNLRSAYYALPSWKVLKMAKRAYIAMTRLKSRGDTMEHWLEQMSVQGTDVLCICGEEEAEAFFQGVMPEQEDLYFGERSHLKIIEGLDHALIPAAQRADVTRMLTNYVTGLDLMGNSKSGNRRSRSAATPQPISN
jgi:hypothetical protein